MLCVFSLSIVMFGFNFGYSTKTEGLPIIQPFALPNHMVKGQGVTITCAVSSGTGPLTFKWSKDGHPLNDQPLSRIQTSNDYSLLRLKSVDSGQAGNYTCFVMNALGSTNHSAQLVVYEHPEWTIIPEDAEIVLGSDISLDCQAEGVPNPKISWRKIKKSEEQISATRGRHQTLSNGTLILKDIQVADVGDFECFASNGIGEGLRKVIRIFVHVPPTFHESYQLLKIRSSHSAILRCDVVGDSPITIKWSKDYVIGSKDNRYKTQQTPLPNGLLSELYITRVGSEDAGVFTCVALNDYGKREKTIKLVVLEPPASPSEIVVKQIDREEAVAQWSAPYSGNSPVTRYVLQFWRDTGAPPKLQEESVASEKTSYYLKSLRPGTSYVLRIIAENEFGSSTPSVPVRFSTAEDNPSGYPTDLTVIPKSPYSVTVRWKAPAPEQRNGAILGYDLGYREHYSTEPYVYKQVPLESGPSQEYQLDNLKANKAYEIVVRAFNRAGRGPAAVPVIARTRDKGHLVAPILWVESTSATTVALRWSGNEEIEGEALRHSIHYRPENGHWVEKLVSDSNSNTFLLTDLEENTLYHAYIQALNGNSRSNPSTTVSVRTTDSSLALSSLTQVREASYQTTLVISLSVVISCVVIVCVIVGACIYVTRVTGGQNGKRDGAAHSEFAEQPSTSRSTPLSRHPSTYRYVDVNSRPLLWCSTPAPPNDYPSPYATLPLRPTPVSKRWQSDDRLSPAPSERSVSLANQRVDIPEEKSPSNRD